MPLAEIFNFNITRCPKSLHAKNLLYFKVNLMHIKNRSSSNPYWFEKHCENIIEIRTKTFLSVVTLVLLYFLRSEINIIVKQWQN